MVRIPRKLKNDPIVEALFEVRFTSDEVSEVVLGKLAANWKDLKPIRLPLAEVPSPVRDKDPNLAHQPLWQLQANDGRLVIKFGPRVFSYHALEVYPGWSAFEELLPRAVLDDEARAVVLDQLHECVLQPTWRSSHSFERSRP